MSTRIVPSPLGRLRITEERGAITEIAFVEDDTDAEVSGSVTELLEEAAHQLDSYFKGERSTFDLPLAPEGTPFQQRVWQSLGGISYGQTRTYQHIADALCSSARPVGQANGKNPLAIVIPCHRVVGTQGLTGYAGGLWRKQWLLAHEGALPPTADDKQQTLL